jgi:N-acyl amino acid synthase of PEP-CTERM/exosortase system
MELNKVIESFCNVIKEYSFYSQYHNTFTIKPAKTAALQKDAFRIRFDVFNKENSFFEISDRRKRSDEDEYDSSASHALLVHNLSGTAVGALRVNFFNPDAPEQSFLLQSLCDHPYLHDYTKLSSVCEISKMCMVKEFRRRSEDGAILPAFYEQDIQPDRIFQRIIPYAPLGMFTFAIEQALSKKCMYIVSMFEISHLMALKSLGVQYKVLGPQLSYMGKQQPVIINIKQTLDRMFFENRACWEVVTNHGQLHELATHIDRDYWDDSVFNDECINKIISHLT